MCVCFLFCVCVCKKPFLRQSGHSSRVSSTTWASVSPSACHWVPSQLECVLLRACSCLCLCTSAEEGPPMMSLQCQQQTPLSYPCLILWATGGWGGLHAHAHTHTHPQRHAQTRGVHLVPNSACFSMLGEFSPYWKTLLIKKETRN